jgi:hypothetical protein
METTSMAGPCFDRRQTVAAIGRFWDAQLSLGGTNYARLSPIWLGYGHQRHSSLERNRLVPGQWQVCLDTSTPAAAIPRFNSTMDFKRGLTGELVLYVATHINCVGNYHIAYQMLTHKL